jgi:hypothetical protein
MGGFKPIPIDPLPTPEPTPVQVTPASISQPPPPQGGYVGKGGQVANIAANFLHGWLAGRELKEKKMQDAARAQVAQSYQAYQNLQQMASDPSMPEEQRKKAADMLGTAWSNYVSTISKYAGPKEGEGKKKGIGGKVKGALKGMFEPQQPELTTQSMVQMLQNLTPIASKARGPTPEQELATAQAKEAQLAIGNMEKINKLTGDLQTILQNPNRTDEDNKKAQDITLQINSLKGQIKPEDIPTARQRELKDAQEKADLATAQVRSQVADSALSAFNKKHANQPLTDQEQRAYDTFFPPGQPPSAVEIYARMKGKGVKDPISGRTVQIPQGPEGDVAALNLAARLEAKHKAMEGQFSFEMQNAPIKDAIRARFKILNGREPTQDELKKEWLDAVYGTGKAAKEGVATGKEPEAATVQDVFLSVASMQNGRFSQFFHNKTPTKLGPGGKEEAGGKPDEMMKPREGFSPEQQKEWDLAAQEVAHALQDRGYSNDMIAMIVGQEAVNRALHMAPPPPPPSGAKKVRIIAKGPNGEVQEAEGTEENIEAIKKEAANNHWTIEVKPIGELK